MVLLIYSVYEVKVMNIITVTLNPAIDVHVSEDENGTRKTERHSGGKGINVSRTLTCFGVESLCYTVVGEENKDSFLLPLTNLNIMYDVVKGKVRENVHYHLKSGEHVVTGEGTCITDKDMKAIKERLLSEIKDNTVLVFSGSIPPSVAKEDVVTLLLDIKARGARIILDTRSLDTIDISRIHPYLIKPNYDEMLNLVGERDTGKGGLEILKKMGHDMCENIVLTLGKDGAMLYDGREVHVATFPELSAISTTGAGDSVIAGILYDMYLGRDLADSFITGVAFGSASCLTNGTLPPLCDDVYDIKEKITISRIPLA